MLNSLFCDVCLPAQGIFTRSTPLLLWRELEQNKAKNENIKWNFPEMKQKHLMQLNYRNHIQIQKQSFLSLGKISDSILKSPNMCFPPFMTLTTSWVWFICFELTLLYICISEKYEDPLTPPPTFSFTLIKNYYI